MAALALAGASAFLPFQAVAETTNETALYIGALGGVNIPNGDYGSSNSALVGATVGAKLAPNFGVAAMGTYHGQSNSRTFAGLTAGTSTGHWNFLGQANFFASYFHVGADFGMELATWSGSIGSASIDGSDKSFVYGPEAGIDIPLGIAPISVGAEVHYLLNHESDHQNNLLVLGAVKIWL